MKIAPLFLSTVLVAALPAQAQQTPEGQDFSERCNAECIDGHVDRIMDGITELQDTAPLGDPLSQLIPTNRVFQGCPEYFDSSGIPFGELPGVMPSDRGEWADLLGQRLNFYCPGDGDGDTAPSSSPLLTS